MGHGVYTAALPSLIDTEFVTRPSTLDMVRKKKGKKEEWKKKE